MHQDATWHRCRPQPRGLCVRWRPSPPPQKGSGAPKFSAHVYCGQTARWMKMPLGTKIGLSPGDSVLDGEPAAPSQKGGGARRRRFLFSAHVYCGQTARWIKIVLGTEVGLSPGDFALDGDPASLPKFSAHIYCGQTAGWMKLVLGTEVDLSPGDFVLDGDPAAYPKRGRGWVRSIVAKQLHGSRCHLVRR